MSHPARNTSNFQGRRAGQPRSYNAPQPPRHRAREPYSTDPFRGLDPYLDSSRAFETRFRKAAENLREQEALRRHPVLQQELEARHNLKQNQLLEEQEAFLRELSDSNKNEHPVFFRALPDERAQQGYAQHAEDSNKLFEEWLNSREEWKRTQDELYAQEAREREHPISSDNDFLRSRSLGHPQEQMNQEGLRGRALGPPTSSHPLSQESRQYYPLPKDVLDLQDAQSKARRAVSGQQQNHMNKLQSDFYGPLSRMLLRERQDLRGGYEELADLMSDPISGEFFKSSRTTPEGRTYNPSTIEGVRRQQLADEQLYGGFTPNNLRRVAEWGDDASMPDRTLQHLGAISQNFLNRNPGVTNAPIYPGGPTIDEMHGEYQANRGSQMLSRIADEIQANASIPAATPFVDPMTRAQSTPSQHYPNRSVDDTSQMLGGLMGRLNIQY